MVRFKVVHGSRLLLGFSVVVLLLVIGGMLLTAFLSADSVPAMGVSEPVLAEAETRPVFASGADPKSVSPGITIEVVSADGMADPPKPRILIYHTHTHEAYEQTTSDRYVAIEAWRTTDHDHSVVRVGRELARLLEDRGFEVVHDVTDHEQNDLQTAYTRSLGTLMSYDERFDLYIDLHRDAYPEGVEEPSVRDNAGKLARLMVLIGNGVGFEVKPFYEENLAFAEALTDSVNRLLPGLCRDVMVKDGRYNQHIGIFSILIEVGHNRNTLTEALASLPYLADALAGLMIETPDAELS